MTEFEGENALQKDQLFHYYYLLKRRLREKGIISTIGFYQKRIQKMLFSRRKFGRWDLCICPDAQLAGIQNMKIGRNFSAARGLWMETIESYGESDQLQFFKPELIIGDNVSFSEYVHIGCVNHIQIGNNVLLGSKIYITDHNHGIYRGQYPDKPDVPPRLRKLTTDEPVIIEDNVWIGEFCTILPGVTIGYGSIIGTHSTVTHDIPPYSIAVGSPAKVVKQWDKKNEIWKALV